MNFYLRSSRQVDGQHFGQLRSSVGRTCWCGWRCPAWN